MQGGPVCEVNGKSVPCYVAQNEWGGISPEILVGCLKRMDECEIFDRTVCIPLLMGDGHHTHFDVKFLRYIHDIDEEDADIDEEDADIDEEDADIDEEDAVDEEEPPPLCNDHEDDATTTGESPPLLGRQSHKWNGCHGLPQGTQDWQYHDDRVQNGTYKGCLAQEKISLIRFKKLHGMPPTLEKTDVIPLVNAVFHKSFGNVAAGKRVAVRRGLNPLNRAI
jgi:hypothetical protein